MLLGRRDFRVCFGGACPVLQPRTPHIHAPFAQAHCRGFQGLRGPFLAAFLLSGLGGGGSWMAGFRASGVLGSWCETILCIYIICNMCSVWKYRECDGGVFNTASLCIHVQFRLRRASHEKGKGPNGKSSQRKPDFSVEQHGNKPHKAYNRTPLLKMQQPLRKQLKSQPTSWAPEP